MECLASRQPATTLARSSRWDLVWAKRVRWTRACIRGVSRVVGFRPQNFDIDASSARNRPFRSASGATLAGEADTEAAVGLDAFAPEAVAKSSSSRASKALSSNALFDVFFFRPIHRYLRSLLERGENENKLCKYILSPIGAARKCLRKEGPTAPRKATFPLAAQSACLNICRCSHNWLSAERGKTNSNFTRFCLARRALVPRLGHVRASDTLSL